MHRSIWNSMPLWKYDSRRQANTLHRYLRMLAAKPALAATVSHWSSLELPQGRLEFFSHAKALTHLFVNEMAFGGVFNAVVEANCPLRNMTIISATTEAYSTLNLTGFMTLKPTLRRLALLLDRRSIEIDRALPGTNELLSAIAAHLGDTLQTLSVVTNDWHLLKPMKALKELFISYPVEAPSWFVSSDLDKVAATLLATTPPGIGVNLVIKPRETPLSLIQKAAEASAEKVVEMIEKYGADPNLAPYNYTLTTTRIPILVSSIEKERVATALIAKGADVAPKGRRSAFWAVLLKWRGNEDIWTEFATKLFDQVWPTMIRFRSAADLLGFPPQNVLFHFLESVPSSTIAHRTKFVLARPEVFGQLTVHDKNPQGCNLLHSCAVHDDVLVLEDMHTDWRAKDNAGLDALECMASKWSDLTTRLFKRWCETDEDFIKHCTPQIWGLVTSDLLHRALSTSIFKHLVDRMMELIPPDRWEELITASVQIQLRDNRAETLLGYIKLNYPQLTPIVWRAVFRPWSELQAMPWIPSFKLSKRYRQPLPHIISSDELAIEIGKRIPLHFRSEADALAWIEEKNPQGLTAEQYLSQELSGAALNKRLEVLKKLAWAS